MTRVTGGTEIIKRHHLMTPIENGVLGDLEDLVVMAQSATGKRSDDAAKIVMDDEHVHVTWEEVVEANYEADLDKWTRFAVHDLDHDILVQVVDSIKKWRARGK